MAALPINNCYYRKWLLVEFEQMLIAINLFGLDIPALKLGVTAHACSPV